MAHFKLNFDLSWSVPLRFVVEVGHFSLTSDNKNCQVKTFVGYRKTEFFKPAADFQIQKLGK